MTGRPLLAPHAGDAGGAWLRARTFLRAVAGAWLALASVSCERTDMLTACPPAPLRLKTGEASCDFGDTCHYAAPDMLGTADADYCNGWSCFCQEGQLECVRTAAACSPHLLSQCPPGAEDGAACTQAPPSRVWGENGECAVPGPAADLSRGIIDGFICACDLPGPVWRCLSVASTSL